MMGRLLVIGVAVVVGTALIGWWAVPAIGLAWGFVAHRRHEGVPSAHGDLVVTQLAVVAEVGSRVPGPFLEHDDSGPRLAQLPRDGPTARTATDDADVDGVVGHALA